jgi:hypothetical protein
MRRFMRPTIITYKVRPESAAVNEKLIRAVFDELAHAAPDNVRYTVFALGDEVSFVHIVEVEGGENPLPGLMSFKRYTESVLERCQEPPSVNEAREVGSYGYGDRQGAMVPRRLTR